MPNDLTLDLKELWERWAKIYLNIMMLKSHNPEMAAKLVELQNKAMELNQVLAEMSE